MGNGLIMGSLGVCGSWRGGNERAVYPRKVLISEGILLGCLAVYCSVDFCCLELCRAAAMGISGACAVQKWAGERAGGA